MTPNSVGIRPDLQRGMEGLGRLAPSLYFDLQPDHLGHLHESV